VVDVTYSNGIPYGFERKVSFIDAALRAISVVPVLAKDIGRGIFC